LLLFIVMAASLANAQNINPADSLDWDTKSKEVENLYRKGDYDKAIATAKYVVQKAATTFGKLHANYLLSISNLAFIYKKIEQYKDAEVLYKEAVSITKQKFGNQHPEYLGSLRNLANLYLVMYEYELAEPLYIEISTTIKKRYGTENNTYASSLYDLGVLYDEMQLFEKAKLNYTACLAIRKRIMVAEEDDYIMVLNDLAALCNTMGDYAQAETYHKESLRIREKRFGKISAAYALSASNLGVLYMNMNRNAEAEVYLKDAFAIRASVYGREHHYYAASAYNLGSLYLNMGRYALAQELLKESINVYKKSLGEKSAEYAKTVNMLANSYVELANYEAAFPLFKEALNAMAIARGKKHSLYALILNDLGLFYQKNGDYKNAEDAYKECLEITKAIYGNQHPEYATSLNNLATLYHDVANYSKAEILYKEALDIRKTALGAAHIDYASSLSNLAGLYADLANYYDAESMYKKALEVNKLAVGTEHPHYSRDLANLASMYQDKDDYQSAEPLLREAVDINKKIVGKEHPRYAESIYSLGKLLQKKKDFANAEPLLKQAMQINRKTFGEKHPSYCDDLNALGSLYTDIGNYAEAEKMYKEAIALVPAVMGKNHPDNTTYLNNLVLMYYQSNNVAGWSSVFDEGIKQWVKTTQQNILKFSEVEKEEYLFRYDYYLHSANSMLYYNKAKRTGTSYYATNCMQGWLLQSKKQLYNIATNHKDPIVQQTLLDWQNSNTQYAKAIQMSIEQQEEAGIDTYGLFTKSFELEKKLINLLPQVEQMIGKSGNNVSEVAAKLKTNEVLVHWVAINYFSPKGWTDSVIYAAYIIKPKDTVATFVPVCEQRQLVALLKNYHGAKGRSTIKTDKKADENIDSKLYNLVWRPLLPYLFNSSVVYNLPAGQLHKLSFISLADTTDGKALLEKYELHQLLSINELLYPEKVTSNKTLTLFGGANYNKANNVSASSSKEIAALPAYQNASKEDVANTWTYLPGTKTEVESIAKTIVDKQWKVVSCTDENATETKLKMLSGFKAPQILHISTHGFYFPPPQKSAKKGSDNSTKDYSLLRSGIVLSGVNNYWGKNKMLDEGMEDGIVTAQEIANLNFQNVELVVLSACQTALGDIDASEGVYGLQRAFKMAGAKKLIISLWEVPDAETAELMQLFYTNIQKGETYYSALRNAQLTLKAKYKNTVKWAGFVLIGE